MGESLEGNVRGPTRVSVIIPTRNRSALLREALASVRAVEGDDLSCEILVVNDGSSDSTNEVAAEFGARIIQASPAGAPQGRGTAAARNAGLREATGEFVAFLDDDDVWTTEHLRPHLALLQANPNLITVFGQLVNTDEHRTPVYGPWPAEPPANWDTLRLLFQHTVQIGAFVSRITVRDTVGWFDETDPEAYDWDWCFRVVLHGEASFVPVPSVLFRQRDADAFQDATELRRNARNRNLYWHYALSSGRRRPPLGWLARTHLRYRGMYYAAFARVAEARARSADRAGARKAITGALRVSPLHALCDVCRPSPLRTAVAMLVTVWGAS